MPHQPACQSNASRSASALAPKNTLQMFAFSGIFGLVSDGYFLRNCYRLLAMCAYVTDCNPYSLLSSTFERVSTGEPSRPHHQASHTELQICYSTRWWCWRHSSVMSRLVNIKPTGMVGIRRLDWR